jgi:hypothetical protein
MMEERLRALLGPDRPELSCEQCFAELDWFVELSLVPGRRDAFAPCSGCATPAECVQKRDCLGMHAHLAGCPACAEEHASLAALVKHG